MRILLVISLILLAAPASGEVYRYVDENGTVVFTDQRPSDDARPMDLPEPSVMESRKLARKASQEEESEEETEPELVYPSLTMLSPKRGETFQGTGNTLPVRLVTREALRTGDQVVVYLDGQEQGRFQSLSVDLQQVPRGTHEVRTKILDENDNVVGDSGPVTIHMKQHSRLHQNQPMVNQPQG
jgi:hypothetical protein